MIVRELPTTNRLTSISRLPNRREAFRLFQPVNAPALGEATT